MARHLWIVEWDEQFYQTAHSEKTAESLMKILTHRKRRLYRVTLGEPVKVLPAKEER